MLLIDQREQYSRSGPGARTLNRTGWWMCVCVGGVSEGVGGEKQSRMARDGSHWDRAVGVGGVGGWGGGGATDHACMAALHGRFLTALPNAPCTFLSPSCSRFKCTLPPPPAPPFQCPPESLRHHAAAIAAQGVTVDSSVTLPCGDVAWVAQHKTTKQRYVQNPVLGHRNLGEGGGRV